MLQGPHLFLAVCTSPLLSHIDQGIQCSRLLSEFNQRTQGHKTLVSTMYDYLTSLLWINAICLLWTDALIPSSESHLSTQHATDGRNVEEIGEGDLHAGGDTIVARFLFFPILWWGSESYPEWLVAAKAVCVRKFWKNAANSFCDIISLTSREREWNSTVVQLLRCGNSCQRQHDNMLQPHVLGV